MISLHKISSHFLPHFLVSVDLADAFGGHDRIHHRAHALSPFALFVYLQLLVVFGATLLFLRVKAPEVLGTVAFSADQIISLTNQKRAQNGLGHLSYNPLLANAALAKAANMLAEDYWAHNSPSGRTPWSFITAAGYRYVFAGENLARDFDSASSVVDAWMNSPTHRDNILDKNFVEIGVAVAYGKLSGREGILVVQEFGAGVSSARASTNTATNNVAGSVSTPATPKPTLTPSPTQFLSPSPITVIANEVKQSNEEIATPANGEARNDNVQPQALVLASRQFSIAKNVSLVLVVFIFLLFLAEVIITFRREKVSLRSGVLAHLLLLAFVLFALWYAVGGAVL